MKMGNLPRHYKFIDLTGQRFGRLIVVSYEPKKEQGSWWICACECGGHICTTSNRLRQGRTSSCGCYSREAAAARVASHQLSHTREYQAFHHARARCERVKDVNYKHYGGRGIEFRFKSFEEFIAELGLKPSPEYTLERKDVNGHYEPGNVRWATQMEQGSNKRNNRQLTIDGVTHTFSEWSRQTGIRLTTAYQRIKYGWCDECIFRVVKTCIHKAGGK